jgi:hypothetical protein
MLLQEFFAFQLLRTGRCTGKNIPMVLGGWWVGSSESLECNLITRLGEGLGWQVRLRLGVGEDSFETIAVGGSLA